MMQDRRRQIDAAEEAQSEYIYGSAERKDDIKRVAPRIQGSVTFYITGIPRSNL